MIKIDISHEKKRRIEAYLLKDLVGNPPQRCGKLIDALSRAGSRRLVQNYSVALHDYLYKDTGEPDVENVKELLLADRRKMELFIKRFTPVHSACADDLLDKIFQYKNFANRKVVCEILREMEIPVCPYCNRLYITVLKRGKVRAQMDHFFPKTRYPYLALCLYNLVPSCGVCNQAKSELDTKSFPLLYPYEEEFGEEATFALDLKDLKDFVQKMQGASGEIQVRINNPDPFSDFGQKVSRQDTKLHLTDLYNEHGAYIADILRSYHVNTEARVTELLQRFPDLFSSRDEIRSLIFMSCLEKNRWRERPLAKLTHDICCELDALSV